MGGNPIKAGTCTVVSLTVNLPSACYLRIEALAKSLGVPVGHAAALTIYAGQAAQDSMDAANAERHSKMQRIIDELKAIGGNRHG